MFTKCWLEYLKLSLPTFVYKQVLTNFHEMVLPHLTTPVLLMDFLSSSYDVGGVISLLSLNGLFLLMHKHNLDYPDFFPKLYGLLKPDIFYVKYRARFFKLANIFLSSTHLPTYLVCAFAKRLARLALLAPPPVSMAILPLVYNIIVMHPAAQTLLHRTPKHDPTNQVLMLRLDADEIAKDDPFSFDEMDPSKSRASESSLWEIQALANHYVPSVSTMAKIFDIHGDMRKQQYKLEDEVVDQSYQSMLQFELKRRNKHGFPLAFNKPSQFFSADLSSFDGFAFGASNDATTEPQDAPRETSRAQGKPAKRKRQD
jgi:U3 small nucleolar RNA-associated protein 19